MTKSAGYLRLTRPANIITAMADILLGCAAAGVIGRTPGAYGAEFRIVSPLPIVYLLISTAALYAGGVVLNDVFDTELDRIERPERPIPSGLIDRTHASIFGGVLLGAGVAAAAMASQAGFVLAAITALCILLYDAWGKRQPLFGPVNMGLCRGANLMLGMTGIGTYETIVRLWPMALIPVIYIATITMISRGEVHGGTRGIVWTGVAMYGVAAASAVAAMVIYANVWLEGLPFLLLFIAVVVPPGMRAASSPDALRIREAVRAGVISLIILDAALAAGFAGWGYGILTICLLPISMLIARRFAVT